MTQDRDITDTENPTEGLQPGLAPWTEARKKIGWGGLLLDPTSTLFVSLFLMLFAFFAVMNANTVERPREASEVMESLRKTFGGMGNISEIDATPDPVQGGELLEARGVISAEFPEANIIVSSGGDKFEASVSVMSFFVEGTPRLAPSRELFLKALAQTSSKASAQPLMIEIAFAGGAADIKEQRRVAAIAATLEKYGASSGNLSAVWSEGEAGEVRLSVSRR